MGSLEVCLCLGGPEAAISSKQQEDLSFKSLKEFVFAYRVREICCGKAGMENRAFMGRYPSQGCYCEPEVENRAFVGRYSSRGCYCKPEVEDRVFAVGISVGVGAQENWTHW